VQQPDRRDQLFLSRNSDIVHHLAAAEPDFGPQLHESGPTANRNRFFLAEHAARAFFDAQISVENAACR
jgi:hypothetical protein